MGNVIFNGVSSEDLGLIIQIRPSYGIPKKDRSEIHITGKNGDVVIDNGSYANSSITYYFASLYRTDTGFILNASAISTWLHSASGYARLEDSYDPEVFRLAKFNNSGSLSDIYGKATTYEATFECKPQRFLKSGENDIVLTKGSYVQIVNPTKQIAKPIIQFNGTANNTFYFYAGEDYSNPEHTSTIVSTATAGTMDCELEDSYNGNSYINSTITLTSEDYGYPKLYPGVNYVRWTGGASGGSATIKPRWWSL